MNGRFFIFKRCESRFGRKIPKSALFYCEKLSQSFRRFLVRYDELIEIKYLDWEEVQRKQHEEVEKVKKEREILATWFLREEYLNAGWFKRLLLRIEFVFRDTRGESHIPQIPEHIRKEIARCLLPDIVAYFESEQGQKEFEAWKIKQESERENWMQSK